VYINKLKLELRKVNVVLSIFYI